MALPLQEQQILESYQRRPYRVRGEPIYPKPMKLYAGTPRSLIELAYDPRAYGTQDPPQITLRMSFKGYTTHETATAAATQILSTMDHIASNSATDLTSLPYATAFKFGPATEKFPQSTLDLMITVPTSEKYPFTMAWILAQDYRQRSHNQTYHARRYWTRCAYDRQDPTKWNGILQTSYDASSEEDQPMNPQSYLPRELIRLHMLNIIRAQDITYFTFLQEHLRSQHFRYPGRTRGRVKDLFFFTP